MIRAMNPNNGEKTFMCNHSTKLGLQCKTTHMMVEIDDGNRPYWAQ